MASTKPTSPLARLPRAALLYGLGDAIGRATNLVALPILTRAMNPAEFGIVVGVTAYAQVLSLAMQLNLSASLIRFHYASSSDDERRSLISTLVWFNVAWSVILVLGMFFFGRRPLEYVFQQVKFNPYLILGTLWAALMAAGAVPLAALQAKQKPAVYRAITGAAAVAGTAVALTLVVRYSWGALGSITGLICGAMLTVGLLAVYLRRDVGLLFSPVQLRKCLIFSLPLAAYSVGGWMMDQSNRVIIAQFLTLQDLGIYGVASQIGQIITLVLTAVGTAFTPLFYEQMTYPRGPETVARFGIIYLAGTVTLILAITGFAHEIVALLTGSAYKAAVFLVTPLALTQSLNAIWQLIMPPLLLRQRTGVVAMATLFSAVVSVGLSLWFVPAFGVIGAAFAPLLANVLLNAVVFRVSIRELPVPYAFGKIGLMIVLGAAVGLAMHIFGGSTSWLTIAIRSLLMLTFPLSLIAVGVLPKDVALRAWNAVYGRSV